MILDEFEQMFREWSGGCATRAWWKCWAMSTALDAKADFQDKANLEPVLSGMNAAKVTARDASAKKSTRHGR